MYPFRNSFEQTSSDDEIEEYKNQSQFHSIQQKKVQEKNALYKRFIQLNNGSSNLSKTAKKTPTQKNRSSLHIKKQRKEKRIPREKRNLRAQTQEDEQLKLERYQYLKAINEYKNNQNNFIKKRRELEQQLEECFRTIQELEGSGRKKSLEIDNLLQINEKLVKNAKLQNSEFQSSAIFVKKIKSENDNLTKKLQQVQSTLDINLKKDAITEKEINKLRSKNQELKTELIEEKKENRNLKNREIQIKTKLQNLESLNPRMQKIELETAKNTIVQLKDTIKKLEIGNKETEMLLREKKKEKRDFQSLVKKNEDNLQKIGSLNQRILNLKETEDEMYRKFQKLEEKNIQILEEIEEKEEQNRLIQLKNSMLKQKLNSIEVESLDEQVEKLKQVNRILQTKNSSLQREKEESKKIEEEMKKEIEHQNEKIDELETKNYEMKMKLKKKRSLSVYRKNIQPIAKNPLKKNKKTFMNPRKAKLLNKSTSSILKREKKLSDLILTQRKSILNL